MRILGIRFKNLNSLVGEWEIDLTHPSFVADGLFAVTGPTGAGKTTLFDAICLALYGGTPRLGRITASHNEILSRQTGECFAEASFETRTGRFRCHFRQHRAHNVSSGALQTPEHEIVNADSGEILESTLRGTAAKVEELTGMDFERFIRSMLLAQGGFAVFLQASPDERSPILEQITGTEIYSRISIRVHEIHRAEQEKLRNLRADAATIVPLTPEQEEEIRRAEETARQKEKALTARLRQMEEVRQWLAGIEALKGEIKRLTVETDALQNDIALFRPARERLDKALRAASLEGVFATLTARRKQQTDEQTALEKEKIALPGLESATTASELSLKSAEQQSAQIKSAQQAAAPLMQTIRALDQKYADQNRALQESEENCRKEAERIAADESARQKTEEKRARAEKEQQEIDTYLEKNAQDERLIGDLAGIEEQGKTLLTWQREKAEKENERKKASLGLTQAEKRLAERRQQASARKEAIHELSRHLAQEKVALNALLGERHLREYRAEKDACLREMGFLKKIVELEAHRTRLEDGKPCPLCGATEHPFATGNVPVLDETEQKIGALTALIAQAETREESIRQLEQKEIAAREARAKSEQQEAAALTEKQTAEKTLAASEENQARLQTIFTGQKQALLTRLAPLGIHEIADEKLASLFDLLKARLAEWKKQSGKKIAIAHEIVQIDGEIKRIAAVVATQARALGEKQKHREAIQKEVAIYREERQRLYGEKNPDEEEKRLASAVSASELAEKKARAQHDEWRQKRNAARTRIESLEKRLAQGAPEQHVLETGFLATIEAAGFADERCFLDARLDPTPMEALTAQARALDERRVKLDARRQDSAARLATEIARNLDTASADTLETQIREGETLARQEREKLSGLQYRLNENARAKALMKEKQGALDAQHTECQRWERLHSLIGSSDGRKYRNFAQGLTFEMMLVHANRQLQKMTDRYSLIHDDTRPLELDVIDHWQADEIRSTKNLSGGESFIVSLALALGLSQMASRNTRVDSLFLDEGFGMLDEETLDTALEALASLHADGKLIGVISHVPMLKERINTQIQLIPLTGGRSQLSGPGCRQRG